MKNYQLELNNGKSITITGAEFDSNNFAETLNSHSVLFVNIGGAIINKQLIATILPITDQNNSAE